MATPVKPESAVKAGKRQEGHWQLPQSSGQQHSLKVWNSLTRSKVDFVPVRDRHITWYNCGPTVYDASHMGHARNYVTQDVLRRILRDYFGYNVHFVMNVTDIDDKIIVRARQQHLYSQYRDEQTGLSPQLVSEVQDAWQAYFDKFTKGLTTPVAVDGVASTSSSAEAFTWDSLNSRIQSDAAWLSTNKESNEKFVLHMETLAATRAALATARADLDSGRMGQQNAWTLLDASRDIVSAWLDKKSGSTVTDPAIFRALAAYWEKSFFEDMEKLHVDPPTTLTRVSEYVPEVAAFVQTIVEKGFAYATQDGSVYFDVARFDGANSQQSDTLQNGHTDSWCHTYAKLQPWNKSNRALLDDGEGSLTTTAEALKEKKSPSDFALWKASKPGEPAWDSPWGPGRPGWHIECSVMASEILGDKMDIHSGGIDLAYPHHDNEMAQSEAFHDCRQWVNYFLHTGHLHIEGLKMSKSLKNFITIDEALQKSSARQLRLAFLLQPWNARMDYKESGMAEVKSIEGTLNKFFTTVKAFVAEGTANQSVGKHTYAHSERALMASLADAQSGFHEKLCDSFNTPDAMQILLDLVSSANVYINSRSRSETNVDLLANTSEWVTKMLRLFGLGEGPEIDSMSKRVIGWGQAQRQGANGSGLKDREALLMPYLRALSTFRDGVRQLALGNAKLSEILELCDRLRDQDLVDLGVALDDQEDGKALVKLAPAEQLRAARDEKAAAIRKKAEQKAASQAAAEAKKREKLEKGRLAPQEMYKSGAFATEFSKYDEDGLPTHDAQGEEVSKSRAKKLKKDWDAQAKLHEAFLADQSK